MTPPNWKMGRHPKIVGLICTALVTIQLFLLVSCESEKELSDFINGEYEREASSHCYQLNVAEWNFATDVANKDKQQYKIQQTLKYANFSKQQWERHFKNVNPSEYNNETLQRQLKDLVILGVAVFDPQKLKNLTEIESKMTNIYSTAKVCPYQKQDCNLEQEGLSLEPGIEEVVATSTDYDELKYVWEAWRNSSGAKMKSLYKSYVELSNEAARANNFEDMGEMWRMGYESPTFIEDVDKLWMQVKPLYDELHRYAMKKLKQRYGDKIDLSDGLIPAHVLGNMWGQSWLGLKDFLKPYPGASEVDVTEALKKHNYTVLRMFEESNNFYKSLGLEPNDISYNVSAGAMIKKPVGREVLCHASAWDFCDGQNYRIKMCTQVNYEDFITIHHEMGHIQYYLQYKHQPITFRSGANPGFHEAVGDTIALSVATPTHLQKIGLLENYVQSEEASINALMEMALERVAFLPFGLLIDKWRWDVFAGKVAPERWNDHWWKYRTSIQKVKPPSSRSDDTDFDPAAKYHVAGNSQYINYFVAHILEFQLYKGLCIAAKQYDPSGSTGGRPLHQCDFYQSKEAGDKFRAGLSLGSSKHWSEALQAVTGERALNASAILEYFDPLYKYLKKVNGPLSSEELAQFLSTDFEEAASKISTKQVVAEWDLETDVNNKTKAEIQLNATLEEAEFSLHYWKNYFKDLALDDYKNVSLKRAVKSLKLLGNSALDTQSLKNYTNTINQMTNIYSTGKVCPFTNLRCDPDREGLSLDPDLYGIMASSTNYDELKYVWKAWRDATGAKMKDHYKVYVELSNKAAVKNGFKNMGEMWKDDFESPTFVKDMDELWSQVEPLYKELHSFVSRKLKARYGDKLDVSDGFIPAHALGNMWAQTWQDLSDITKPYPDLKKINITDALLEKNYTPLKMFQESDNFYRSMGLESNAMSYNETLGAMITKPKDRDVVCHASAWDFSDGKDFRIKMCTRVNQEDFITIHHEMGHIQYFILYKDQPITFRAGANPGFHEAVGDTIALSVSTPKHLKQIGLIKEYEDSREASLNALMDMALERVAFLPFGLLIDKWRWDVFEGSKSLDEWNSHWWDLRMKYQRVKPPVPRSDLRDFDPGAKFHVPADSQYISYFVAHILEFQLYRSLCITAGQYDPKNKSVPLHACDFYNSKAAGAKLRAGLSLGASKHWKDALEAITGERDLKATAILEYFEPLYEFLKDQNGKSNDTSFSIRLFSSKYFVCVTVTLGLISNFRF